MVFVPAPELLLRVTPAGKVPDVTVKPIGAVPPDVMPYTFGDNWLFDASAAQQRRLQTTTVEAIAALHDVSDAAKRLPYLEKSQPGETHLRRHVASTRAGYDMGAREGAPSPLVERGFEWLAAQWPDTQGRPGCVRLSA